MLVREHLVLVKVYHFSKERLVAFIDQVDVKFGLVILKLPTFSADVLFFGMQASLYL